jgi:hypothetical protein
LAVGDGLSAFEIRNPNSYLHAKAGKAIKNLRYYTRTHVIERTRFPSSINVAKRVEMLTTTDFRADI